MWFAEFRQEKGSWTRLRELPYKHQEQAKAACKAKLASDPANTALLIFRTVADDATATVYEMSLPPHGWRLRWIDSRSELCNPYR